VGFPGCAWGGFIFRVHPALFRIAPIFSFSVVAMILCSVLSNDTICQPYISYPSVDVDLKSILPVTNMLHPSDIRNERDQ
jgi:hypothetical protein